MGLAALEQFPEHFGVAGVFGQHQFKVKDINCPQSDDSVSEGRVTFRVFELFHGQSDLLAVHIVKKLPLFFVQVHGVDVHEIWLVVLKNSLQSSHFLLCLLFEGVLLGFFGGQLQRGHVRNPRRGLLFWIFIFTVIRVSILALDVLGPNFARFVFVLSLQENKFGFFLVGLSGNFDSYSIQKMVSFVLNEAEAFL